MQGRFTQSAIKVLKLAQYEAKHLKHRHVGTEHILLGLLHEGTNVAAKALSSIGERGFCCCKSYRYRFIYSKAKSS